MDTSGVTHEELVTIMGHIMPEPEVEIREGVTTALWHFSIATGQAAGEFREMGMSIVDDFVRVMNVAARLAPFAWKLDPAYQRYQCRAARLNARPRPSKRHGARRGVK